jgi:hypothetical protein
MGDDPQALRPAGGSGRSFLGVRRMEPQDDGVHLYDDDGNQVGLVPYGENVYINGRVISFNPPKREQPGPEST